MLHFSSERVDQLISNSSCGKDWLKMPSIIVHTKLVVLLWKANPGTSEVHGLHVC